MNMIRPDTILALTCLLVGIVAEAFGFSGAIMAGSNLGLGVMAVGMLIEAFHLARFAGVAVATVGLLVVAAAGMTTAYASPADITGHDQTDR